VVPAAVAGELLGELGEIAFQPLDTVVQAADQAWVGAP
jgi:hypothetical protein